jgi:Fe-S cluster biogenesis protein NfuA
MPAQPEFQKRLQSIERLVSEIDRGADPNLRSAVQQLVQLVMDLHGAGLERIVELIQETGGGAGLLDRISRDEMVESLLVLHGLHPLGLEARIHRGIELARSRLRPHRGEVELIGLENGAVRLRMRAHGSGCGSTGEALKEIVESAIYQPAPDVLSLDIETGDEKANFVPIEMLHAAPALVKGEL